MKRLYITLFLTYNALIFLPNNAAAMHSKQQQARIDAIARWKDLQATRRCAQCHTIVRAAVRKHPHCMHILLEEEGHNINATAYGKTVLHWAAECGSADVLEYLLDHEDLTTKTIQSRDQLGWTFLHAAVASHHATCLNVIVAWLKQRIIDGKMSQDEMLVFINAPDKTRQTALNWARAIDCITTLVEHGAIRHIGNPMRHAIDDSGETMVNGTASLAESIDDLRRTNPKVMNEMFG